MQYTMNLKFVLLSIVMPSVAFGQGNFTKQDLRKHYGLSINNGCAVYVKVFKCLTACKSMGYQIFRLNSVCKCTCHDMKTSTILPFFKWRTNGTTRAVPKTQSPKLYHIVGTLSPPPKQYSEDDLLTTTSTAINATNDDKDTTLTGTATDASTNSTTISGAPDAGAPITEGADTEALTTASADSGIPTTAGADTGNPTTAGTDAPTTVPTTTEG